jgi:GH15 family glucan-1,4-alpha-glucosidase
MHSTSFKLLYLCFVTLFLLAACDSKSGNPTPDNSANLKATSAKNYTVALSWDALTASKVMLERSRYEQGSSEAWRVTITDTKSHQKHHFASFEALLAFFREKLEVEVEQGG